MKTRSKIAASACLAVIHLALTGCPKDNEHTEVPPARVENGRVIVEPGSPSAASVSIETAQPPAAVTLPLNGRIVWDDNVTTRLFTPFAGRVTKIHVEAGESIEAGAPLAAIASPDFGQAQADARRAATDFALAERTVSRLRELSEHGAAAQKDLQATEAELERARLEKERTAKRLALYGAAADLDQAYILKSPIAGVVVEKTINPGAELRNDQMLAGTPQLAAPLFVITDPTKLWIQIDVPERDYTRLCVGQSFVIKSASLPGQSFTGRVDVVSDSLDPNTHTVKARGSVVNDRRLLKAETFVTAEFTLPPEAGTEIPLRAVLLRGERHCVLVEEAPGRYARREVTLGGQRGGRCIITDGIVSGQRVVVEGAILLERMLNAGSAS
jgi:cobalt-zinc-cadmium efflux system membrane fusion protein